MADADLEREAADAPYIFVGTVEHAGASSVAGAPADEHTAIVRVERVVRAPATIGLTAGSTVTVRDEDSTPQAGERALYLADSWVYGDGIAVNVRARQPMEPADARGEGAQPDDAQLEAFAQAPLRRRAQDADLIVRGKVVGLEPADARARGSDEPASEHDAQWWNAEIAVDDVLKGEHRRKTVRVAFPGSRDVAWYGWPRPVAGQEAVFLLHQPDTAEVKNAYVMPHRLDVQPYGNAEHVQALARRGRSRG